MRLGGQIAAAIDVLHDVLERHRPASLALADWGRSHRFAGSKDRSVIGTLVYDALRKKASLGWRMDDDSPRGLVLGVLRQVWAIEAEEIAAICDGAAHSPAPLTDKETNQLQTAASFSYAPDWVSADMPEWLFEEFRTAFSDDAAREGAGLAERAPIDLRVNTLKADRTRVMKALARYAPQETPFSPLGLRIAPPGPREKNPNIEAEAAHGKGWFEVQDEASQIAMLLSGAGPRLQLLDLCAGAGGKTLGFAAMMQNTGQIHAYDADKTRLRPIFERLKRSGARNVQVLPAGDAQALAALEDKIDIVFVDAPCTGSGVWRRRPDAKWRLTREALADRIAEQRSVLETAASMVKAGGRLIYATCSLLPSENRQQTDWFLRRWPNFAERPWRASWDAGRFGAAPDASEDDKALQLTPARHGGDGFYVSILERAS